MLFEIMTSSHERLFQNNEIVARENMEKLRKNPYPGRGIVMGYDETRENAIQLYWVMGRSENSRNRVLVQEGSVVKTLPFDESKVQDPSLIIYNAMVQVGNIHIVSNGNQTDILAQTVKAGNHILRGIYDLSYEPDTPNFTPRISGLYIPDRFGAEFEFSTVARMREDKPQVEYLSDRPNLAINPGIGKCFHTYEGDGSPLPAFKKKPYPTFLKGSIDDIADTYWDILNKENRVGLAAKAINIATGMTTITLRNQLSR